MLSASLSSLVAGHVAPYEQVWVPDTAELKALIDADTQAWVVSQQEVAAVADAPVDADLADMPAPAPFAADAYDFTDNPAVEEPFDIPAELPEGYVSPADAPELEEQLPAPELPAIPEALLADYDVDEDELEEVAVDAHAAEAKTEAEDALPAIPEDLTRDYDVDEDDLEGEPVAEDPAETADEAETLPAIPADLTREYDVPENEEEVEPEVVAEVQEEGPALPEAHEDLTREYDVPEDEEAEEAVDEVVDAFAEADLAAAEVEEGPALPEVPEDILTSADGDVQPRPEWNPEQGSSTIGDLPPVPDFLSPGYSGSFLSPGEAEEVQLPSDEAPSLLAGVPTLTPTNVEDNPYVPSSSELEESLAKFDPAVAMGMKTLDVPILEDPNSDLPAGPALKAAPSLTGAPVEEVVYNLDEPVDDSVENYTASFSAGGTSLIAGLNDLSDLEEPEEVENPFTDSEPDLSGFEPSRYFGLQNEYDPFNDALPQDEQSRVLAGDLPAPVAAPNPEDVDVAPIVDQAKAAEAPRDSRAIMKMLRELNTLREA